MIAGRDDHTAQRSVAAVRDELDQPDALLRWVSLEELVDYCQRQPSLSGWATKFRRRYLDLVPVADRFPALTTGRNGRSLPAPTHR